MSRVRPIPIIQPLSVASNHMFRQAPVSKVQRALSSHEFMQPVDLLTQSKTDSATAPASHHSLNSSQQRHHIADLGLDFHPEAAILPMMDQQAVIKGVLEGLSPASSLEDKFQLRNEHGQF